MKTTMYLVLTTKLAIANFYSRKPGFVPMLNDLKGDLLHHNLEDAVAAGINIAEDLEGERGITIVHVIYDRSLHEELAFKGDINGTKEKDYAGRPMWSLTAAGAARLNGAAQFLTEVFPLPDVVKKPAFPHSTAIN